MTELTTELISTKIFEIRGQKVMLDRDLADLYQVKPFRLREQVKRNIKRFSCKYMFQLTEEETNYMVSQNAIPSKKHLGGSLPYVFTEHGTLMLATVLNSDIAIEINQKIIDVFVYLRKQINTNPSYTELKEELNRLERQIINVEDTFKLQQRIDTNSQNKKIIQLTEQVGAFTKIMNEFQDNNLIIKRPEEGGGVG
jgi:hypothetical protein